MLIEGIVYDTNYIDYSPIIGKKLKKWHFDYIFTSSWYYNQLNVKQLFLDGICPQIAWTR